VVKPDARTTVRSVTIYLPIADIERIDAEVGRIRGELAKEGRFEQITRADVLHGLVQWALGLQAEIRAKATEAASNLVQPATPASMEGVAEKLRRLKEGVA